jgi:hypothetical protein
VWRLEVEGNLVQPKLWVHALPETWRDWMMIRIARAQALLALAAAGPIVPGEIKHPLPPLPLLP